MRLEEFNKYLSYVRNLGFEETPDYDFLRELFTQALKNTGEVEDGEYDWMKLNGGRGWEAAKQSSRLLHNPEPNPNPSAQAVNNVPPQGGRSRDPRGTAEISKERLNAAHPPTPGSPAQPNPAAQKHRERTSGYGGNKRTSGLAGPNELGGTPTASTQAAFRSSDGNLVGNHHKSSQAHNAMQTTPKPSQQQQPQEQSTSWVKKMFACCGTC